MKQVHISISDELKKELEKEAKSRGLTLNGYIRMVLIERGK